MGLTSYCLAAAVKRFTPPAAAVTRITAVAAKRCHPPHVQANLHVLEMARIAIRHYGSDAPAIMRRRVEDQVRHGDAETDQRRG
jgi:hypothetical protein